MKPVERWVEQVSATLRPDRVVWCDGSEAENARLVEQMLGDGTLHRLHEDAAPGSYLHRSHPSDVARTEHLTFIASRTREDAGPTNNWMSPGEARQRVGPLFDGAMKGRTLYVVPYVMGPLGSPVQPGRRRGHRQPVRGREHADHDAHGPGRARRSSAPRRSSCPGSTRSGDLSPERRFIVHFPEERSIWSVGSGYGGNALLGKKCFALRIASTMARDQGWMAEHMLILELELPDGEVHYIGAAFPSACGKTNLAMLVSPLEDRGYRVRTVGDDIAWLRPGADGRLWAVNPEAGFFGVVPGTGRETNPNALATIARDTIFTNVAVTARRRPVVGGEGRRPARRDLLDWQGQPWDRRRARPPHPNSRFTVAAPAVPVDVARAGRTRRACPLSAIVFGGRRARVAPLVYQSRDWAHGVFVGRDHGLGDHRRRHRAGGRGAPRPDGDAAVLRLQHGRLLRPLARDGPARSSARRRSST